MEITLNVSHLIVGGILLIVLAMLFYAYIQIKAIRSHLSSIQASMQAGNRQWQNTRAHLDAAEADITEIRQTLGLADGPPAASPDYGEAEISRRLTEFTNALTLFKQQVGKGKG